MVSRAAGSDNTQIKAMTLLPFKGRGLETTVMQKNLDGFGLKTLFRDGNMLECNHRLWISKNTEKEYNFI